MKREGRQHGMVRTYRILPPGLNPRPLCLPVNRLDAPPTAGIFTKVSPKPTNHSKFTGRCGKDRCGVCHMKPSGKAKDKTKGSQKLSPLPRLKLSGASATGILDYLSNNYADDYTDDYVDRYDHYNQDNHAYQDEVRDWRYDDHDNHDDQDNRDYDGGVEELRSPSMDDDGENDMRDHTMSFYEVGTMIDLDDGDEGWCLLEGM